MLSKVDIRADKNKIPGEYKQCSDPLMNANTNTNDSTGVVPVAANL